ncbi:MAG: ATP-grasp domain-containing protein [Nitrososphaerales archaeon]|nr:ATP-grasp domain-containing protein [Nitrososphaerales archaeon]
MKVGIFEYIAGGGIKEVISGNMLCEGYSMLKSAIEDFQSAGYEVTTLLDSRLTKLKEHMKAEKIEIVSAQDNTSNVLHEMLKTVDLSLIIAPETGGTLSNLVQIARSNTISLNSTPESIDLVSNKAKLAEILSRKGFPVPKTYCIKDGDGIEEIERVFKNFSTPLIVKPLDGAGCAKVFLVNETRQLIKAQNLIMEDNPKERVIIQEFVEGIPVSVSLILNGMNAFPISLNLQKISLNTPPESSCYYGGITPFRHPDEFKALNLAKSAVEQFNGLRGYIGVDMVMTSQGPFILEINPRLTVSYIGLKRISKVNLAKSIVKASSGETLPTPFKIQGVSAFSKIPLDTLKTIRANVDVICPQIQIEGSDMNYIFFALEGKKEFEIQKILMDLVMPHHNT